MSEPSHPAPAADGEAPPGDPASEPEERPARGSRPLLSPPLRRLLRGVVRILGAAAFAGVLLLSGWLGVETAKRRSAPAEDPVPGQRGEARMVLGSAENPLYLSDTPGALREFFSLHQSHGDRASASLAGLPIRRISSPVELAVLRADADAVEIRLLSGPIAGAVYWLHHSQVPEREVLAPIIDPLPQ